MKRMKTFVCALLLASAGGYAQSVWNPAHLSQVKQSISQPVYSVACQELLREADALLERDPLSVMMKESVPASGDKHDYMSLARYWWPDPSRPDGKPYVNRDGVSNPELNKLDRVRMGKMADRVVTLSLAHYFSGDDRYARKAVEQLRVWFLDKETRMNPNLNYAQIVPGRDGDRGRSYGVLDAYSFVEMLDGVQLLEASGALSKKESKALKAWFGKLLDWMLASKQGREESTQANNHSVAYDAQVVAFARYVGKTKIARQYLQQFAEKRLFRQISPDGSQPQELRRTLAFGYSQYNLAHILDLFQMAEKEGLDLAAEADGRFHKAVDFLMPYWGKEVKEWPYKQISGWEKEQAAFGKTVYRSYLLHPDRTDYLKAYKRMRRIDWKDRFNLLYYVPDVTDNAYAFAEGQLRYALKCTAEARKQKPDKRLVSPRCVEKDGRLRVVGPNDWCSGFFPGSLWYMHDFTHSDFWREWAVSYTWPLEEVKWNKGTHDIGFMVYNSFGHAWHSTGERSYRDVALQAAKSLVSRYNPKTRCLRSWDHGTKRWKYPVIIDNMMNLELLFWATQETGDSTYCRIAVEHANTTLRNHFRPDYSSYHVVDYDPETGAVRGRCTHQGIADDSFWSRGQGWGLYGYAMCYRFTKDPAYLKQACGIADFFFSLPNLPEDLIPYWDMKDPAIPDAPRDASAAAVMASGLYELSAYVPDGQGKRYKAIADRIVENLYAHYQAEPGTSQGFLLLHSTGNYPSHDEIDKPISYADYYYLEALFRKNKLEQK